MAIDYAKLFQNPEALGLMSPEEMGLVDPEAFRQLQEQVTLSQTPVQPEVTAQAIRPDMSQGEMQKQLYNLLGQSFTEQSKQIEQLRAQAAKERELQDQMGALGRLDIRPFAQAVRGYGATNVAVPEEAPKDRTEILNKLEQAISSAQQGMTRDQVLALRNMMEEQRGAKAASQQLQSEENFNLRLRSTINSSEQAKKIRAIGALNSKLTNLEALVQKTGAELTGKEKADLESSFKDAEIAWKEAANLGALTGPDVGMIQGALGQSPTSLAGIGRYALSGGKKGLMSKIRGAKTRAITEGQSHLESLQATYPYPQATGIYSDLNKKLQVPESEADKIRKELKALKESK